jgi:hypothetical protein
MTREPGASRETNRLRTRSGTGDSRNQLAAPTGGDVESSSTTALTETAWNDLIDLIKKGKCTPFIGAGASGARLPIGSKLARQWARENAYPLKDTSNLTRVAQFLAIRRFDMFPKEQVSQLFQKAGAPDFSKSNEPHAVLADLNLPIYITTNYDEFMLLALKDRKRDPRREFCRWNGYPDVIKKESIFKGGYVPSVAQPLVFHLHGYHGVPQSMVLTEDDYLDFLIALSERQGRQALIPTPVRTALAGTALLFVGYSLSDWTFRVLFRGLRSPLKASLGYPSIAIQLPPDDVQRGRRNDAQEYLQNYFGKLQELRLAVYWGDVGDFATELRERWEAANG